MLYRMLKERPDPQLRRKQHGVREAYFPLEANRCLAECSLLTGQDATHMARRRPRPADSLKGKSACATNGEVTTRPQKHRTN
jgi:hypothetical protein